VPIKRRSKFGIGITQTPEVRKLENRRIPDWTYEGLHYLPWHGPAAGHPTILHSIGSGVCQTPEGWRGKAWAIAIHTTRRGRYGHGLVLRSPGVLGTLTNFFSSPEKSCFGTCQDRRISGCACFFASRVQQLPDGPATLVRV
jgi:hypothetical protein